MQATRASSSSPVTEVPGLRAVLHGIRETVEAPHGLVAFAEDCPEQVATYLLRQYLRGRIAAYQVETGDQHGHHCGLDRAFHMAKGEYLVRVDDSLELQPGWLEKAIGALRADPGIGCLSLVQPPDYQRKRGRPAGYRPRQASGVRQPRTCAAT